MATEYVDITPTQMDIWEDSLVLHFLRTHQYQSNLTSLNKDRVHRRAKGFRWLAYKLYKIHNDGRQMLLIPPPLDRNRLVQKVHRDMRHFGIHRVLDRLKKNYWWKGIDETVKQVIQACVPCARAKAGFRVSSTELQPLRLSGVMFR